MHFQTFQCKWCGTRFCRECLKGDFKGDMKDETPLICQKCKQPNCQGKKVEFVQGAKKPSVSEKEKKGGKGGSKGKAKGSKKKSKK